MIDDFDSIGYSMALVVESVIFFVSTTRTCGTFASQGNVSLQTPSSKQTWIVEVEHKILSEFSRLTAFVTEAARIKIQVNEKRFIFNSPQ